MHIRGINQETLAAQAQYAEWRRRLQDSDEIRVAARPDEAEKDQEARREGDGQEEEAPEEENAPGEQADESAPPASDDEDDGQPHLRSFA